MPEIELRLADVHAAVAGLVAAAERVGTAWTKPRAPGKWSPSQVVEHVARIMEESANVAANSPAPRLQANTMEESLSQDEGHRRIRSRNWIGDPG
jgi:hypothetical protein